MPRVESNAEVTLVVLVYRSLRWLDWCMEGVDSSKNHTKYRWLVVANDADADVRRDPRVSLDFENDDKTEFYINRVYRAWNAGVLEAPTQWVVMLNSDMWPADYWLDELMEARLSIIPRAVPTSLLVESGRIPSGMPEYVRDFGQNPDTFHVEQFREYAAKTADRDVPEFSPGRLYMPILVDRQEFLDIGGYPEGNPPGTTGDKDLIRRYAEAGFRHVTVNRSIVYHAQCGEQNWP